MNGGTFIFNEDSADLDFRIEGNGDANLFFTDAGNDRVGIKTGSPSTELHVVGGVKLPVQLILMAVGLPLTNLVLLLILDVKQIPWQTLFL